MVLFGFMKWKRHFRTKLWLALKTVLQPNSRSSKRRSRRRKQKYVAQFCFQVSLFNDAKFAQSAKNWVHEVKQVNLFQSFEAKIGFLLLLSQKMISLGLCSQTLWNFRQKTITRLLSLFLVSCTFKFSAFRFLRLKSKEIEKKKKRLWTGSRNAPHFTPRCSHTDGKMKSRAAAKRCLAAVSLK